MDGHPDDIRAATRRLLDSPGFAAAPRLRRFLQYIVDRTLAGEAGELKEYVIGVDVFDRDQSYDPRIDSIVRVEATRLRAKIDEYYAGEGAGDPLLIRIPRGSYVPAFEKNAGLAESAAPSPDNLWKTVPERRSADRRSASNGWRLLLAGGGAAVVVGIAALAMMSRREPASGLPAAEPAAVSPTASSPAGALPSPQGAASGTGIDTATRTAAAPPVRGEPVRQGGGGPAQHPREMPSKPSASAVAVAVLPFEHFTTDERDALLAARVTDEITVALARERTLSVASRTSARQFGHARRPAREIAAALGVEMLVEGSVTFEQGRVRINARLVDALIDRKMGARLFEGTLDDVPALAARLARGMSEVAAERARFR